ncbi:GntR family transcriptional regulator [Sphaerotilus sp.]|uniref:GntR family transcriptional regulator n=1 Tax=Sphaerotilus sp. TaxID=2093942 RepID=UPI0025D8EB31|nr:GntR family transcriptional regulator [Sphaerotilus sp.]
MAMTDAEIAPSQTAQAQQRLRELIVSGALLPGERLLEVPLAERLGVSRTPVRAALLRLEQEGLLEAAASGGGYRVRQFSPQDVRDAIELRGTLEGLAARMAAERGVAAALLGEARACLAAIDDALGVPTLGEPEFAAYEHHNGEFHALLGRMCGSTLLGRELLRTSRLPFASPNGFLGVSIGQPSGRDVLRIAQDQHRQVLDAIAQREGSRAEALMREHARIARRRLEALAVDESFNGSLSP